jgi:hypothetical protein
MIVDTAILNGAILFYSLSARYTNAILWRPHGDGNQTLSEPATHMLKKWTIALNRDI